MADVEFDGITSKYNKSKGEAIIELHFVNYDNDSPYIIYDAQFDLGIDGNIDHSVEGHGITTQNESTMSYGIAVNESELPIDVEVCVQITGTE